MKALKVIAIIFALLVLLVVGIGVYVFYNTDRLVDSAVETLGTEYLGAPVKLGSVDLKFPEGRATLKDLEIGNPPGYEGPYAMHLDEVSVTLDPVASTRQHVALQQVTIDGAKLAAIVKGPGDSNFKALVDRLDQMEKSSKGSSSTNAAAAVKLSIARLDFTGAQASITAPLLGKETSTTVPDVHLKDIGNDADGATVAEVLRQLLEPVTRSVLQKAAEQQLGDSVKGKIDDAMERLLGHPES